MARLICLRLGVQPAGKVGRNGAPMRKILQKLQRLRHYVARANAMYVRYEADSARVVFVGRVVQSLRGRLTAHGRQIEAGVTAASSLSPVRMR